MSTRKAFAFSFVDRYAGLIVHVVSAMVIARLLTPSEIGVYSLVMVLVGFIATFRDLGAGQYLVQKKEVTADDIRATWTVQLGIGLLFGVIIAIGSRPVAGFYSEPRMRDIMLVLAANFAITPFQALPNAWLTRQMRFGGLAVIRFTAAVAHASFAIVLTWSGLGPVSLAWANLASTLVGIALGMMISDVRPPWKPRITGIKEVVSFGGRFSGVLLLGVVKDASPELFLGKLQGMTDTGLFSRGQGLVAMFERLVMDAVNAVALPFFARQARDGLPLAEAFVRASALTAGFGWSFLGCLATLAFPIVRVLYGDQWDGAVDATRWLAAAMALSLPVHVSLAPMLASGAVSQIVRVATVSTAIAVAAAGVGAWIGLATLCTLLVPAAALSAALWLWLARQCVGFAWGALLRTYFQSALVAAGATAIPFAVSLYLGWRSPSVFTALVIGIPGAALGLVVAAVITRHPLWEEAARLARWIKS